MSKLVLRLYIAGHTPRSERAIRNLRGICERDLAGCYDMQVIDLVENPEAGDRNRIVVTPTLIKQMPLPLRRIIGDLSNRDSVVAGLDILSDAPSEGPLQGRYRGRGDV
jgi:circadian clock protein KaiB